MGLFYISDETKQVLDEIYNVWITKKHYDSLIKTRKSRFLEANVYYEKHHIIMRSMGGTDESNNLVHLTAREHFIAHLLLWKIYRNNETAFSFKMMCFKNKKWSSKV